LNETFDSEDSELKNLDWEEWEEDIHYDITEDDFPGKRNRPKRFLLPPICFDSNKEMQKCQLL
jgi:hypothetical protein